MLWLLLVQIFAAVGSGTTSCTHADIKKAMLCTASLKSKFLEDKSPSTFMSQGDTKEAIHACGNGDLLTAVNCIQRVMEECKNDNTDAAHYLRKMVDTEKARETVNFFCTNVHVYAANAKCIAQHHKDQDTCAEEAIKNFQTQASATQNMDVLMRFQCILYHEVLACAEKVISQKCSVEAADIVKTVMIGFEPPICTTTSSGAKAERAGTYDVQSDAKPGNRGQRSACHSLIYLLVLSFFMLLLTSLLL